MHECDAMQNLETKKKKKQKQKKNKKQKTKKTKPKNNGHKGQSNEAQGPRQKDSISSSPLHPKPFRCTMNIGVLIHMGMITNSKIGIKV